MRAALAILCGVLLSACAPAPVPGVEVPIQVVAGPVCPVVTDPPDPSCADRPVAGAELAVIDAGGEEVARVTTDRQGRATLSLPAGAYTVRPQPVEGLMGTPSEIDLVVAAGSPTPLVIAYETGIR